MLPGSSSRDSEDQSRSAGFGFSLSMGPIAASTKDTIRASIRIARAKLSELNQRRHAELIVALKGGRFEIEP